MSTHCRQLADKHGIIGEVNLLYANVKNAKLCCIAAYISRGGGPEQAGVYSVRKIQYKFGGCDVSLCQGYVAIWPALAMIRLKHKVL